MKKLSMVLAAMLLVVFLAAPVQAAERQQSKGTETVTASSIGVQWLQLRQATHGITLSSSGKCVCAASLSTYDSSYQIDLYVELQRLENGSFTYYDSWDDSGTGYVPFSRTLYVPRGTYRQSLVATIQDANGRYVERVPLTSTSKTY